MNDGGSSRSRDRRPAGGREAKRTRRRVSPLIRVGISVPPEDVHTYASQFRVLEADAGASILPERVVGPWVDRTPEGFVVDVRAHRILTHHPAAQETVWPEVRDGLSSELRGRKHLYAHDLPARALDTALDRFLAAIAPAREFGRLGTVVFPFPSYFRPSTASLDYLAWLRGRSGDVPLAVELRHREWVDSKHRAETMRFFEEQRIGYVAVDVPPGFESSLPPLTAATAEPVVVHFHGRNAEAWQREADSGDDHLPGDYRRGDLDPWVTRVEKLAAARHPVHVVFTTGSPTAAARNARLFVRALSEEPAPAPAEPARTGGSRGGRGRGSRGTRR